MSTGQLLDGIFASEHIDSSGEILEIDGLDISDFEEGRGAINYEHQGHDDAKSQGQEIVGKVVFSRKIRSEKDCENDRQKMFWDLARVPFLYGVARLYDSAGHEGAKALAAIIRDSHANNEPLTIGWSIEGSTLEKTKDNRLKHTIARRVALTLRPCNKMSLAGLLADPNAPEGYVKDPVSPDILAMVPSAKQSPAKKAEHQDPRYIRLGGSEAVYGSGVTKAMSAGGYGGAPGTLTNGSALQVEDKGRFLKAQAAAAYRDWDRVTPFRDFLKSRLPEASDDFLDHFNELVERQLFRVRKAVEVISDLKKQGKLPNEKKLKSPAQQPVTEPTLTIQGRNVPPPMGKVRSTSFDAQNGTLVTKRGVFQVSTPSNPHPHLAQHVAGKSWVKKSSILQAFHDELQKSRPAHQRAMQSWLPLNDKFSRGEVDPGLVAHAAGFALMSPGNPVPIQEMMWGHYLDSMRHLGHTVPTVDNVHDIHKEWMSRNRSGLPEASRDHFRNLEHELRVKNGPNAGRVQGYAKPDQFHEYFGDYLKDHHNDIVQAIRDAKGDSHVVARRLTDVRGIAPKIARYMLGMLGAGNMVVPDTHFARHLFGGRPDAPGRQAGSSPDSETAEYIKSQLLGMTNSHDTLEGVDEHYFNNHDAVKAVLNDPTLGPYFKGKEKQAIFPAFWWHWTSIPGHENRIGTPNRDASNEGVDHAPFWEGAKDLAKNQEEHDPSLPMKTAMQHHRWLEAYGPVKALGLFHKFLVPKLLANDQLARQTLIRKFEALQVDMFAALQKDDTQAQVTKPLEIQFNGRTVKPGLASAQIGEKMQDFALLHAGAKDFMAVPHEKVADHSPEDLIRLPRHGHPGMVVHSFPETKDSPLKVDVKTHGVEEFLRHPHTQALAEGFDFGGPTEGSVRGMRQDVNYWAKTPSGQKVYVKPETRISSIPGYTEPRAEAVYHNLAHDFFGLGHYVPPVALVRHPQTGKEHALIQHVPGYELPIGHSAMTNDVLGKIRPSGDLDKLAMMNMIMGNADRHSANMLLDDKSGLHLIDHNLIFQNNITADRSWMPEYWDAPITNQPVHPKAYDWVHSLQPDELRDQLMRHEVPPKAVAGAVERLKALQTHLKVNPATEAWRLWDQIPQLAREKLGK